MCDNKRIECVTLCQQTEHNLHKMDKFLEKQNLLKLAHNETEKSKKPFIF